MKAVGRPKLDEQLKQKTYRWSPVQLKTFAELSAKEGTSENTFVRNMVDKGIEFTQVKEEGYTIMPVIFSNQQLKEIKSAAEQSHCTEQEVISEIIDQAFKIEK